MYNKSLNKNKNMVLKAKDYQKALSLDLPTELVVDSNGQILFARFVDKNGNLRKNGLASFGSNGAFVSLDGEVNPLTASTELACGLTKMIRGESNTLKLSESAAEVLLDHIKNDSECKKLLIESEKLNEDLSDKSVVKDLINNISGPLSIILKSVSSSVITKTMLVALLSGSALPSQLKGQGMVFESFGKVAKALKNDDFEIKAQSKVLKDFDLFKERILEKMQEQYDLKNYTIIFDILNVEISNEFPGKIEKFEIHIETERLDVSDSYHKESQTTLIVWQRLPGDDGSVDIKEKSNIEFNGVKGQDQDKTFANVLRNKLMHQNFEDLYQTFKKNYN